jgi:Ca-activated chloride channel family protein
MNGILQSKSRTAAWCVGAFLCAGVGSVLLIAGCASRLTPEEGRPIPLSAPLRPGRLAPSFAGGITIERAIGPLVHPDQALGSRPSLAEELWVVARARSISAVHDQDIPEQGSLIAEDNGKHVPLPLKHTDVQATIEGYIATVTVLQQYQNPFDHKIEAVYVFPLPENAAVNEFLMIIGERRIRGIIRERAEAEKIYHEAKAQGYVASLLTEERPNVFTQSVANIEPGKQIDVRIHYFHTLIFDDGWHEFVFPMVVGPRFNPAGSTTGVGAAPREQAGVTGQKTEIQSLAPNERSGHDISLGIQLHAATSVEEVACRSHRVTILRHSPTHASITLSQDDAIPNKDFVLRFRVGGERVKAGMVTADTERGGFFSLMLYPPLELRRTERQPLEIVFVLDCSGSMDGIPIQQAKAAVRRGLHLLRQDDSFQLINFSMSAAQLGRIPLDATPANIQRGLRYLDRLDAEGGTMMIEGIKAALDFPHHPGKLRFVCFLTDGYIGNEADILRAITERVGPSRIFSFGVGSSPNHYLLDGMARLGRGAVAYLSDKDDAGQVMGAFFQRIQCPGLTDVAFDWHGADISEVFPSRIPDLFVGRAVVVNGRFQGHAPQQIEVLGQVAGRSVRIPVRVATAESSATSIASVWARSKIATLIDSSLEGGAASPFEAVRQVALDFNLMSAYTAFVAVDSTATTAGTGAATVPVAVPVPVGVQYEKTVEKEP